MSLSSPKGRTSIIEIGSGDRGGPVINSHEKGNGVSGRSAREVFGRQCEVCQVFDDVIIRTPDM